MLNNINSDSKNNEKTMIKCDECGSLFYKEASKMKSLCPECSHFLYEYERCNHTFKNGRCTICYWDGSSSKYIDKLKKQDITNE